MIVLLLTGVLALVLGGCACVWRAARGDAPRWVRAAATATLAAGELVRRPNDKGRSQSDD
ncbi:hypothetical protein ABT330_27340 [Streptomyces sp. NPDC000658]|uniref:hypothetical protein n=1 Tax=Streptomyces sp. NPDC000658 TaxID=3154266 RepID=UPI0033251A92